MIKTIRKLYITLITLVRVMTTITVSDDTRVKVVRRKDEVLTSQDKVIRDLLERAEAAPGTASNEPCKQCEEYKRKLEKSSSGGPEIQALEKELLDKSKEYDELEADYNAACAKNDTLKHMLNPVEGEKNNAK